MGMRRIIYIVEYRLQHWPAEMWDEYAAFINEIAAFTCVAESERLWVDSSISRPEYRVTEFEMIPREQ